jgi:arginyl-tRNA synthetase
MNVELILKESIHNAFAELFKHELPANVIKIQPTNKEFKGTHTFVTFPYLRISKLGPEETGKLIGEFLRNKSGIVEDFNIIKGFLNLELNDITWLKVLESDFMAPVWQQVRQKNQKMIVEYSSPNTNKPLHLGHLRNNFLGYAVSNILEASGYDVQKVTLVNDRGIHICKSMVAYQKFSNEETPESSKMKGDHLVGKYYVLFDKEYKKQVSELIEDGLSKEEAMKKAPILIEAQNVLIKWEEKDEDTINLWKKLNGWVYDGFDITYKDIGVSFDKTYYESEVYLLGKDIVEEGLEKGTFYKDSDGSAWVDMTEEGLDKKLLLRADGTAVYMTQDLGTADLKYHNYPFNQSIYVVGNEQDYHFDMLFKILDKLERPYANNLHHLSYGMVDLPSGKMKSREGTVVDADDLVEEMILTAKAQTEELGKIDDFNEKELNELYKILALGALKYFLLKIDPQKRMMFNPQDSIQFQGNTGPFIQYTYARISAIIRKANELDINYSKLQIPSDMGLHETEKELIMTINNYGGELEDAAAGYAPSIIANYCYELAKTYNRFYTEVSIFNLENNNISDFSVLL